MSPCISFCSVAIPFYSIGRGIESECYVVSPDILTTPGGRKGGRGEGSIGEINLSWLSRMGRSRVGWGRNGRFICTATPPIMSLLLLAIAPSLDGKERWQRSLPLSALQYLLREREGGSVTVIFAIRSFFFFFSMMMMAHFCFPSRLLLSFFFLRRKKKWFRNSCHVFCHRPYGSRFLSFSFFPTHHLSLPK